MVFLYSLSGSLDYSSKAVHIGKAVHIKKHREAFCNFTSIHCHHMTFLVLFLVCRNGFRIGSFGEAKLDVFLFLSCLPASLSYLWPVLSSKQDTVLLGLSPDIDDMSLTLPHALLCMHSTCVPHLAALGCVFTRKNNHHRFALFRIRRAKG